MDRLCDFQRQPIRTKPCRRVHSQRREAPRQEELRGGISGIPGKNMGQLAIPVLCSTRNSQGEECVAPAGAWRNGFALYPESPCGSRDVAVSQRSENSRIAEQSPKLRLAETTNRSSDRCGRLLDGPTTCGLSAPPLSHPADRSRSQPPLAIKPNPEMSEMRQRRGSTFSARTKLAIAAIHRTFITPPTNKSAISIQQQPRQ